MTNRTPSLSKTTRDGAFAPGRRGLTIGLVLTVTLVGFESLAVSTALPAIKDDLHGLHLYGWVFSAFMLGNLVGIVIAGRVADRHGPAWPFGSGLAIFAIALAVAGAAPTMLVLVIARFAQGVGGGAIPAMAYVAAGRGYAPRLRPRVFAIMSTAWVIPGVIGPSISAFVTEQWGWRYVFFGLLPFIVPAAFLTLPPLAALGKPGGGPVATGAIRVVDAVLVAFGAALVFAGVGVTPLIAAPMVVIGVVVAARAYAHLVPRGTLRAAPGLPATIALRAFQTFAFFGVDVFVPHLMKDVRGTSLFLAGVVVTSTTLAWTVAAWVQERLFARIGPRTFVGLGFACTAVGSAWLAAGADSAVPIAVVCGAAILMGFGMGLGYASISVVMLVEAEPGREGAASASLSLTDVLATAVSTGIAGAAIALADTWHWAPSSGIVLAFALPVTAGLAGAVLAQRLPARLPERHAGARRDDGDGELRLN